MIHGHCECGNVEFEVAGDIVDYSHCHCSQCRRLHGAAFATFAGVARDAFQYRAGESTLSTYRSSKIIDRVFCKTCGSKAEWYDISDDLPCFDEYRPESS
jgi:hypothetical protein